MHTPQTQPVAATSASSPPGPVVLDFTLLAFVSGAGPGGGWTTNGPGGGWTTNGPGGGWAAL